MKRIAIFASGTGSNARKIIEYFTGNQQIRVDLVVSNNANAPVLEVARMYGIDTLCMSKTRFYETEEILTELRTRSINLIVLAGFLWLIPPYLVRAFPNRIINIHPALLPRFGGKGMYGIHVHQAVKDAGVSKTGITIHFVNEKYDEGGIVFQADCDISPEDSVESIALKVRQLEHAHFAPVIAQLLED